MNIWRERISQHYYSRDGFQSYVVFNIFLILIISFNYITKFLFFIEDHKMQTKSTTKILINEKIMIN